MIKYTINSRLDTVSRTVDNSSLNSNSVGNSFLFYILSLPLLFYYYFGEQRIYTVVIYLLAIIVFLNGIRANYRIEKIQLHVIIALAILIPISLFTFGNLFASLLALRLNFGMFVLILGFSKIHTPNINRITVFLSAWTLGEFLLIRLIPELTHVMPNYDGSFSITQTAHILGGVHSFGGNRSVTATILLALFIFLESAQPQRKLRYLPLIACFMAASGTAYILFFVYLLIKYAARALPVIIIILALGLILFFKDGDDFLIDKFNSEYLDFLWGYKYDQIVDYWSNIGNISDLFFGKGSGAFDSLSEEIGQYGSSYGDFIFLDFIARFGLVGVLLLSIILIKFTKKNATLPIWCLVVGTLHYHVLFSSPGQVIGAYLLIAGMKMIPSVLNRSELPLKNEDTTRSRLNLPAVVKLS
jgi:hypothetical protein